MAGSKSNILEAGYINHMFGGAPLPQPTQWWVAVYDEDPTDNVTSSSPVALTSLLQMTQEGTDKIWTLNENVATNSYLLQFPPVPSSETWSLSHYAIFDGNSSGNPLYHGSFDTPKTLQEGDILVIAAGQLTIKEF